MSVLPALGFTFRGGLKSALNSFAGTCDPRSSIYPDPPIVLDNMRHDPREGVLKFHHGRAQQPAESRAQLFLSTMGEMRRCSGKACPPWKRAARHFLHKKCYHPSGAGTTRNGVGFLLGSVMDLSRHLHCIALI